MRLRARANTLALQYHRCSSGFAKIKRMYTKRVPKSQLKSVNKHGIHKQIDNNRFHRLHKDTQAKSCTLGLGIAQDASTAISTECLNGPKALQPCWITPYLPPMARPAHFPPSARQRTINQSAIEQRTSHCCRFALPIAAGDDDAVTTPRRTLIASYTTKKTALDVPM